MAGTIFLSLAVSRFCRVLGTLLHNGVPIVRSLEISAASTGNRVLGRGHPRRGREYFRRRVAGHAAGGERAVSGRRRGNDRRRRAIEQPGNGAADIADSLERDTWRRLDLFVRLLEPLMLCAWPASCWSSSSPCWCRC